MFWKLKYVNGFMKVTIPCKRFYLFKVLAEVRHKIIFVLSIVSQYGLPVCNTQ